jgi:hypothetical protein
MPDLLVSQDVEDVCLFCRNLAQVSISPLQHDVWKSFSFSFGGGEGKLVVISLSKFSLVVRKGNGYMMFESL